MAETDNNNALIGLKEAQEAVDLFSSIEFAVQIDIMLGFIQKSSATRMF